MIHTWPELKSLALALDLPEVTIDHPWGNECLKAHGKMWCWWSPYVDAAVFRCARDEREILLVADPKTFTLHPHYAPHNLVLVRAGRIDEGWARARLTQQWREAAPKLWLKAWDAARPTA
ncbi:MAG: MmcQ/YjbR family DNA-binding protein [Acetobacteraceae bacterium]|nr:MAG: MmcQ/YjbR family DNA-binding protein [Acetobacteraceae bacterium]